MDKIIGHEKERKILNKLINENKVGHAYLFCGTEGVGKKLIAIEFANQILQSEDSAWNETDCKIILSENDIIKVEKIRELINDIYLKPTVSKRKIFIIDDADKMNANAQNALLKVLEEPPVYATIILITAHKEKIIKTILSRVTEIPFGALSNSELKEIIGKDIDYDIARGSASRATELFESDLYNLADDVMKIIDKKDFLTLNKKFMEIKQSDEDILRLLEMIKILYHKSIKENTCEKIRIIELIDNTLKNLNLNANVDLAIDSFMIKVCK